MGDIISAFSLLLTLVTLLYTSWYEEIKSAVEDWNGLPLLAQEHMREEFIKAKRIVWKTRLLPLVTGSLILMLALIPEIWKIASDSIESLEVFGISSLSHYDSVRTILVLVFLFAFFLWIHLWKISRRLRHAIKEKSRS